MRHADYRATGYMDSMTVSVIIEQMLKGEKMKNIRKIFIGIVATATLTTGAWAECTANIEMGGKKVTGMGNATAPQDAVTKSQLDSIITPAEYGVYRFSDINSWVAVATGDLLNPTNTVAETVDIGNWDTNGFKATVAGTYHISTSLWVRENNAQNQINLRILCNGTTHAQSTRLTTAGERSTVVLSTTCRLGAGQYISLRADTDMEIDQNNKIPVVNITKL